VGAKDYTGMPRGRPSYGGGDEARCFIEI